MNKMERKNQRLIAWVLCVVLIAANIISSAKMQAFASEPETEQEDFEREVTDEEREPGQTEVDENALQNKAVRQTGQEKDTVLKEDFEEEKETPYTMDVETGIQTEDLEEEEIPVKTQTEAMEKDEYNAASITHSFVLLGNGGKFSTGQTKLNRAFTGTSTAGINYTIPSDIPSRTGYTFMGYKTYSSDPTHNETTILRFYGDTSKVPGITSYDDVQMIGELIQPGERGTLMYSTSSASYLPAVWKINTYKIYYYYNNGEQSTSATKTYNKDYTISAKIPVREGYDFLGWDINSGASNVVWNPGDNYTGNEVLRLYAVWKPHTYTINYHENGGKDAPGSQIKTHDDNMKVSSDIPSRSGYTFLGWSENKDDVAPSYRPGDALPEKSIDLYAIWRIVLPSDSATVIGTNASEGDQTIYEDIFITAGGAIKALDIVIEYPDFLKYKEYIKLEDGLEHDVYAAERKEGTKRVLELSLNSASGISVNGTIPLGRILFSVEDSTNYEYGSYHISVRKSESYFIGEDNSQISLEYAGEQEFQYLPYKATGIEIVGESTISETSTYSVQFTPEKTTDKSVSWSVDNDSIAAIDEKGVLTPHKNGTVTITAKTLDGSNLSADFAVEIVGQKAKIRNITVPEAVWKQEFSPDTYIYTLYIPEYCDTVTLTAEFDVGSLLCEGYGYLISGIAKKFSIDSEMQSLVFIKSETDYTDTQYIISFIKDSYAGGVTEEGLVYKAEENDKVIITGYLGTETVVAIPAKIDGKSVSKIVEGAFASDNNLKAVIIAPREDSITISEKAFSDTMNIYNLSEGQLPVISTDEYVVTIVKNGITLEGQKVLPEELAKTVGYKDSIYDAAYYYTDTKEDAVNKWYLGDGGEINASTFDDMDNNTGEPIVFYYTKNMSCDDISVRIEEASGEQNKVSVLVADGTITLLKDYHYTCEVTETGENGTNDFITVTLRGIIRNGYFGTKTIEKRWDEIKEKRYWVRFDVREHGSVLNPLIEIKAGSLIDEPVEPKEEGYQFTGWFKDAECTQRWDFATDTVLDDITLYAGWKAKEEKLVWNIDSQGKLTVKGTGDFAKPASGDADADFDRAPWYNDREKIKSAQINVSGITDISYMFYDCENLASIDLSGLDTSNVTNMAWIFNGCAQLRNLDLSSFNTTAVLDMTAMFNGCTGLENVNLSSFDTKNVTSMYGMFSGCENLTDLDVSSFDTRNVIDMRGTFSLCRKLKKLDLSHFDTGNVLSMRAMFSEDDLLEELVLSSFDTQNVFDMAYLFESCSSLTSLDLGGFDVSQVEDAENMLHGCSSLNKIIVPHHLNVPVALPKAETTDIWYDMNETAYTELPLGLSNGMVLQKNKKPETTEPHLTVTKQKNVYQQGEALNTDDIKVLYYDSNGSVITVSEGYDTNANTIDMSVAGEKTLTVSYKGVSASLIIIVREKEEQGNDPEWNVQSIPHQTYTGKAIKPEVSVKAADDGALLRMGKDYTVQYFNNMNADITDLDGGISASGTEGDNGFTKKLPYVVITGKGNYSGTIYQNFHIDAASIGDGKPAEGVTFKYKDQFVTAGKPQKPFQSLKCKKAMKAGTDFEITLEEVTLGEDGIILARTPIDKGSTVPAIPAGAGGTFLMTVTGTGNYKGTIEAFVYAADKDHLMKNAKITLGKNIKSVPYEKEKPVTLTASETPGENVFTVKFGKTTLNPQNYTVSYTGNDAAGTATLIVMGKGEYIGTKSAAFKITGMPFSAKTISVGGFEDSKTYTGEKLEQRSVVLKDGSTALESGKQYSISYKNNRKKGTASMIFTGNPQYGYSGSFKKTFKITAVPLGKNTVNVTAADYTVVSEGSGFRLKGESVYTKSGTKPSGRITLTDASGTVLQEGTDYTVSYQIPKDAADASMMIKGKGNYSGVLTVYYTVGKAPLAQNQNLALLSVPTAFDSKKEGTYEYRPKLKITDGKKALSEGKDYTVVSYKNCTQQGVQAYLAALKSGASDEELALLRPCAEIIGAGNYTGNASVPVTVYETKLAKKDIRIEISEGTAVYTGDRVKPEVTVYYQNQKLAEGRDYILTYGDNTVAGKNKGSVTVNGIGLYGGSVTQKFTIWGRDIYTVKK